SVVCEYMQRGESLYSVDFETLRAIQPDLIVTQDLCHVCAASPDDLATALTRLPHAPRVVSLTPKTLVGVWADLLTLGEATSRRAEAEQLVAELKQRVENVRRAVAGAAQPRVVCLEWLDPPFVGGHWVPEMVAAAGGADALGRAGEPSFRVSGDDVLAARPEVIVVMPCGYNAQQTADEFRVTKLPEGWNALPAARNRRVFALDANSYASRPGPRLADGVEILAALFHPARVKAPAPDGAVIPLT
ncbi:MAG TPA: ABC transporter substrate-binding protein, partial [Candidatus Acidoferrales bacterium]